MSTSYDPNFRAKVSITGNLSKTRLTWLAAPGAESYRIMRGSMDGWEAHYWHKRRLQLAFNKRKKQKRQRTGRRR